MFYLLC
jgi:hypothetical protein